MTRISPRQYIFWGTIYQKNSEKPNCDTFWKLQFLKDKKQGKQQLRKGLVVSL